MIVRELLLTFMQWAEEKSAYGLTNEDLVTAFLDQDPVVAQTEGGVPIWCPNCGVKFTIYPPTRDISYDSEGLNVYFDGFSIPHRCNQTRRLQT
jgi:hypothetical protein